MFEISILFMNIFYFVTEAAEYTDLQLSTSSKLI